MWTLAHQPHRPPQGIVRKEAQCLHICRKTIPKTLRYAEHHLFYYFSPSAVHWLLCAPSLLVLGLSSAACMPVYIYSPYDVLMAFVRAHNCFQEGPLRMPHDRDSVERCSPTSPSTSGTSLDRSTATSYMSQDSIEDTAVCSIILLCYVSHTTVHQLLCAQDWLLLGLPSAACMH